MEPVIADTARKRGIQADLLHAFNNPIRAEDLDEGFVMLIGGTRSGELLEIDVVTGEFGPVIVHAMPARQKYRR